MIEELGRPMTGDDCRAELFGEQHRDALRAACAEDLDIWRIYSINFGPPDFDPTIDAFAGKPNNHTFVLFDGETLAGISSFITIDESRQSLEIGATFYRPH